MLKYNHYLKELGIKETDYPFNTVEGDSRYIEDEEGFKNSEFFSLDYSLSLYIYSQLCYFRDNCLYGIPCDFEPEQWEATIDKMIEAFKLIITQPHSDSLTIEDSKNRQKKIRYGMRLFIKYFRHLWF